MVNSLEKAASELQFENVQSSSLRIHAQMESRIETITVVVTCYNFASFFDGSKYLEFLKHSSNAHIVFVDDGSRDETLQMLLNIHSAMPSRVDIIRLKKHVGRKASARHGISHALDKEPGRIFCWNAKNPEPLDSIYRLVGTEKAANCLDRFPNPEKYSFRTRVKRTGSFHTISLFGILLARLKQSMSLKSMKQ